VRAEKERADLEADALRQLNKAIQLLKRVDKKCRYENIFREKRSHLGVSLGNSVARFLDEMGA